MASQQVEQIQEAKSKDVDVKEQKRFTQHLIHDCTFADAQQSKISFVAVFMAVPMDRVLSMAM